MRVKPSPRGRRDPAVPASDGDVASIAPVPSLTVERVSGPPAPAPLDALRRGTSRLTAALAPLSRSWLALAAVLVVALALRLYGVNWDANNHLHPDEREIVFRAMCLSFPGQVALRPTNCDPAVTGFGWFFSPASPLNPHFFAYGSFPLYLLAAVCHSLASLSQATGGLFVPWDGGAWDDFNHFTLVGRVLSALFDTASVLLVGLIGRRLVGARTGLLAAALVAVLPFEVQVSHYYAVDTILAFAVLLTLYACVRLVQTPPPPGDPGGTEQDERLGPQWRAWSAGAFVGFGLGLAIATKVSALPLVLPVGLAFVLFWRRRGASYARLTALGILAAAILTFIVTSPYALIDWRTFVSQVSEQTALARGQLDYPYVRQFAGTVPYLYEIQQLLLYDMGLPLGLLGLAGAGWAAWRVWRRWDDEWLIVVGWLVGYFVVVGAAYTKFTRYMLPIFPVLALCGAAALAAWARSALAPSSSPGADRVRRWLARLSPGAASRVGRRLRLLPAVLGLVVLFSTGFLALALDNIYSAPNTRVQASTWIYDHVVPGSAITSEIWDDGLPILVPAAHPGPGFGTTAAGHTIDPGQYTPVPLSLYDEDTPQKADQLSQQLASADVVVISSQRLLRSIPKLPDRYPMTTRYYQLLFDGQLGFTLAAHFTNPPHLLGLTLDDTGADESFSVYDHPPVWIFVRQGPRPSATAVRALLTANISLPAETQRSGSQRSLLLPPAVAAADAHSPPLALQFPSDSLANRLPLLWWLVVVEMLGLVSFPLAFHAFPGLRDRGWGLSKLLGLLALAYALWLPANLQLVPFTNATTIGAYALLAAAGLALAWRTRAALAAFVRAQWQLLAVCEGGFLACFGFFTWVRALDPDLWHIWRGGEKPMELAFLDGILRSRYFPPVDPWFSGGHINYYYYGQYLIAVLVRLTGIAPTTAFNLAIPLLFALTFTAAFSVVGGITGRWWAGLAGGFGLVFVCNLDGAWQAIGQWRAALAHLPIPPFDYWASSRVIPYTINEFPYWSFLYADLHAHLIDLSVVVLIVAGCASLLADRPATWRAQLPTLAALTLALGATGAINTWDFPTCSLLVGAVLVLRALGIGEPSATWSDVRARLTWPVLRRLGAALVLTIGLAYGLYLPFYAHYQTFVSGTGLVSQPTDPNQFFTLFAIWLFLLASFFIVELRDRWESSLADQGPEVAAYAPHRLWGLTLLAMLILALAYVAEVKVLLGVLLLVGLFLALNPRHSPTKLLTYALLLLGLAIALGVELIYVRDFLDNSPWERMNTVFKFYYQVWVCFALGGALAFSQLAPRILPQVAPSDTASRPAEDADHALLTSNPGGSRQVPRRALGPTPTPDPAAEERGTWAIPLRVSWIAAFLLLLCGSLVFLVQGTAARVQDPALWAQVQPPPGGVQPQGLSLDGMAYMRGWYPGDYAALTWLNANPSLGGIPTIIEAASGPYQWYGRVSIYTGLPTVLGSGHEPEQRDPNEVYARQNDVQLFYTTGDPQAALDILHRYGVRYVYVGGLERDCPTQSGSTCIPASTAAVDKYATLVAQGALAPIYQHLGVVIYRVVR